MTSLLRAASILSISAIAVLAACGGSVDTPDDGDDTAAENADIKSGSKACKATPPPNARCSSACPYGYEGPKGSHSCKCCTAPATPAPEVCLAGPAPNWRCAKACPHGYKGPAGTYTCECCDAPVAESCGGPPENARCKACPVGHGYKQIDGHPTCQCCS